MFWAQGWDQAPWLVQRCVQSWRLHNPNWQLVLLDASSIERYSTAAWRGLQLGLAHQSDLLRLQLLSRYGGVWADATTLCRRPLDGWIDQACQSGFFAFQRPGRDRLIANWFLAGQPGASIPMQLEQRLLHYWQWYQFQPLTERQRRITAVLGMVLNRSSVTTRFWFHPWVTRGFRVYPYFVFHYLFERLVNTDAGCRATWRQMPRVSALPPRLIERLGFHTTSTPALLQIIEQCDAPLFKLSWQYDCEAGFEHTLLSQIVA